jgi:hypothetical protein
MRSSDRDYKVLKNALDPYVQMCGLKTLQKFTDSLVPKTQSFIDSDTGQFVGKFYPVKDTMYLLYGKRHFANLLWTLS